MPSSNAGSKSVEAAQPRPAVRARALHARRTRNLGFSENVVLGVAAPLAAAVIWGLWVAPKTKRRLRDPARLALELLLFGASGVALAAADHPLAAAIFLAAVALSEVLTLAWGQREIA